MKVLSVKKKENNHGVWNSVVLYTSNITQTVRSHSVSTTYN